jgi:hypothetical protein
MLPRSKPQSIKRRALSCELGASWRCRNARRSQLQCEARLQGKRVASAEPWAGGGVSDQGTVFALIR